MLSKLGKIPTLCSQRAVLGICPECSALPSQVFMPVLWGKCRVLENLSLNSLQCAWHCFPAYSLPRRKEWSAWPQVLWQIIPVLSIRQNFFLGTAVQFHPNWIEWFIIGWPDRGTLQDVAQLIKLIKWQNSRQRSIPSIYTSCYLIISSE